MKKSAENRAPIIPVDSDIPLFFNALLVKAAIRLKRLSSRPAAALSAKAKFLVNVKRDHALQHPNWAMGAKITIDSATLMNKGLEMIEAKWLFNLKPEQIQVIVHPQSIIHSMVQFEDGSIKAQMGLPDMKLPIQYALAFPNRIAAKFPRYDFKSPTRLRLSRPMLKLSAILRWQPMPSIKAEICPAF